MSTDRLFGDNGGTHGPQTGFNLDDGSGLRVVNARFLDEQKFDWDLFNGYDCLRVLTYSASVNAIIRMLDKYYLTDLIVYSDIKGYYGISKTYYLSKKLLLVIHVPPSLD